ncbi:MAG: formylglycine-generating enzyme family protein [Burkholderiaceae bacterium]|nr:formylglycine-generating enzyme family protein [Burkholderiaceae bacterium]
MALTLGIVASAFDAAGAAPAGAANPAGIDWQPLSTFLMARTETSVAQFRQFVAATGRVTEAERRGGGQEFAGGWQQRPGWTWHSPFGAPAADDEPAVHVTWHEARDFCRWAGSRLPTDAEWVAAAYTEQRESPPAPFVHGKTYPYPTGAQPAGANCRGDCNLGQAFDGRRHRPVTQGTPGVNGLHDMGANAWEWVDQGSDAERRTRGGSWWYGTPQMRADHLQGKAAGTAVVYIGFRCARDFVR